MQYAHRQVYHKACLKCQQCQKRLDQGSVVEHDLEVSFLYNLLGNMRTSCGHSLGLLCTDKQPYCARCHTQLFGTRDLRHANHFSTSSSPLRTPTRASAELTRPIATPQTPSRSSQRPLSTTEFYTPPQLNASPAIPRDGPSTAADPSVPITKPDFRSSRPISVPYAGGSKALDERGLLKRADSPRSKVGEKIGGVGEDVCNGCGKRVYAAEQVNAIGEK